MSPVPLGGKRQWQPRDTVGRYHLLAQIATGGMAEIWLARQEGPKGFEKAVAVKKMADHLGEDPDFVDMFLDEARIAAQLSHPNIVQIVDLGEHQGSYYIAMEYLNGENLAAVVRQAKKAALPLPMSFAARIIAQAAEGLDHAHHMTGPGGQPLNIVHRDVSPQNIILTYDGVVKLVDFGIAKAANRASHTQGDTLKGKMSYLSPEQARSGPVDGRADVFALGIVLYEAITQTRLFQFDDPLQAISAVASDAPLPSARSRQPAVPPALDAVVMKALAKDLPDRYQSAREFQVALEEWLKKQDNAPGAVDLSLYMRTLFPDRVRERAALIESARRGNLTPSGVPGELIRTPPSMPGYTDPGTRVERRPTKPGAILGGILSGIAVLAAAFYWLQGRNPPAPPPPEQLKPAVTVLAVETEPPGAKLSIDGEDRGTSPLKIEGLSVGQHQVVAVLPDRPVALRVIEITQPGEKTTVILPIPSAPAGSAEVEQTKTAFRRPPVLAKGKLSLDTDPWTRVYLGERLLGETPLIEVSVPAGKQRLRLVNDEKKIHTTLEVEIQPGKVTAKKLRF